MSMFDIFHHALDIVKAKIRNYISMIVFFSIVIFSFMVAMQSGSLIIARVDKNFDGIGSRIVRATSIANSNSDITQLTQEDVALLKSGSVPDIDGVSGVIERSGQAIVGAFSAPVVVRGITPDYEKFYPINLLSGGRLIDSDDLTSRKEVVIVSDNFAEKYFKKFDIVGQTIELANDKGFREKFQIIGVMKNEMFMEYNPNRKDPVFEVYIPGSVAETLFNVGYFDYLDIHITANYYLDSASQRIAKLLEVKHGEESIFVVNKKMDVIVARDDIISLFGMLVVIMGMVSLLMGFFGVLTSMTILVRTRNEEFAVRKLLGAVKNEIFLQIQMETIIVSAIGGIIGIIVGSSYGMFLATVLKYGDAFDFGTIIIAFMAILLTGLLAGFYPAKKASGVQIAKHLRHK